MDTTVHRKIMRRVYYSFAVSIVEHPMFWHGVFLGAALLLLAKWLHVASIINNFLAIPVGNAPAYIANSFLSAAANGELLVVAVVILSGLIGASCLWRLTYTFALTRVGHFHAN